GVSSDKEDCGDSEEQWKPKREICRREKRRRCRRIRRYRWRAWRAIRSDRLRARSRRGCGTGDWRRCPRREDENGNRGWGEERQICGRDGGRWECGGGSRR